MNRTMRLFCLTAALLLLTACGTSAGASGGVGATGGMGDFGVTVQDTEPVENAVPPDDPLLDAQNECYLMAYQLLPDGSGAKFHDFIVNAEELTDTVSMEGYTVIKDGDPDVHVRVGTEKLEEDLDGNNCYYDFLYDNKAGYIVAYRFSWKEGFGDAGEPERLFSLSTDQITVYSTSDTTIFGITDADLLGQLAGFDTSEWRALTDPREQISAAYSYVFRFHGGPCIGLLGEGYILLGDTFYFNDDGSYGITGSVQYQVDPAFTDALQNILNSYFSTYEYPEDALVGEAAEVPAP